MNPKHDKHKDNHTRAHRKLLKIKEEQVFTKTAGEGGGCITFKGATIILKVDFSEGTMEAIRQWNKTLKYQNKISPKLEFYIQGK